MIIKLTSLTTNLKLLCDDKHHSSHKDKICEIKVYYLENHIRWCHQLNPMESNIFNYMSEGLFSSFTNSLTSFTNVLNKYNC